jgi:hypothetical protein
MSPNCSELTSNLISQMSEIVRTSRGIDYLMFCLLWGSLFAYNKREPLSQRRLPADILLPICIIVLGVILTLRADKLSPDNLGMGLYDQYIDTTIMFPTASEVRVPILRPCLGLYTSALKQLWTFLKNNEDLFFASMALGRAILHYRKKSILPEAKQLADVFLLILFFVLLVDVTESALPNLVSNVAQCKSSNTETLAVNSIDQSSWRTRRDHM